MGRRLWRNAQQSDSDGTSEHRAYCRCLNIDHGQQPYNVVHFAFGVVVLLVQGLGDVLGLDAPYAGLVSGFVPTVPVYGFTLPRVE